MPLDISVVYHPALPLDRFVALVAGSGLRSISVPQAAIDAVGVIRLRSLLARHSMRIDLLYRAMPPDGVPSADAGRAEQLAGILHAGRVSDATVGDPPTMAVEAAAAHGNDLVGLAARLAREGARELRLEPALWRSLAQHESHP